MAAKVQFVMNADPDTLARLDALRIVLGESRARAGEKGWLEGGLKGLERQMHPRLARLYAVAEARGLTWQEFVAEYAAANSRKTYGPTLEDLEQEAGLTV